MSELESRFTITRTERRYGTVLRLEGVIDESFALDASFALAKRPIVFDMGGVRRVTSFGVRRWMAALRELTAYYGFINCRPVVVSQFNMIANFGLAGELITFFAPYVCSACQHEFEVMIDRRERHTAANLPPEARCPSCGADADFDDSPEVYFSYALSSPRPSPPPHVTTLLDTRTMASTALRVQQEVLDQLTVVKLSGALDRAGALRRVGDGLEGRTLFILRHVTDVATVGLEGLLAIRDNVPELEIAAVPIVVLTHLFTDRFGALLSHVVSVLLPFHCASCGIREIELGPSPLPASGELTCEKCGGALELDPSPQARRALSCFPLPTPSPPVAAYLSSAALGAIADTGPMSGSDASGSVGTFGHYRLLHRLGSGGMAEVFLARQVGPEGFERKVALKRILPAFCSDPEFVEMFIDEARLAAKLSHPNIVQILELGREGAQYFIAMEYVKGSDLQTIIRACRANQISVPVEIVCRIGIDVCAALSAAHSYQEDERAVPIVHRDVSPHNVLVSDAGVIKLSDFGIAKAAGSLDATRPEMEGLRGKVSYFSPERIMGIGDPLDPRQDIFAVGLVLYVCLTGVHPFKGASDAETIHAILSSPVVPAGMTRNDVPVALDTILMRALARKPEDRYANAVSLQMDLESFLHGFSAPVTSVHLAQWLKGLSDRGSGVDVGGSNTGSNSRSGVRNQETLRPRRANEDTLTDPLAASRPSKTRT